MNIEKIKVQAESGQTIEVVVIERRTDMITIAIGEGINNIKCKLLPTRNELAYAGSIMGRELIYERSVQDVKADIAHAEHESFQYRTR